VPIVHYLRNLLGMVGVSKRKELGADLRAVFAASSREQALRIASSVADRWRGTGHEKVAEHIEEHIEECLSCLAFPESHRRRIRTTNGLERLNQEIEWRTRVVRIFPNRESCLRLVTALVVEVSEEWVTGRRCLGMEELREHRRLLEELDVETEEAMSHCDAQRNVGVHRDLTDLGPSWRKAEFLGRLRTTLFRSGHVQRGLLSAACEPASCRQVGAPWVGL
jgi:hypothetical protein